MNHAATRDSSVERIAILFDSKGRQGAWVAPTICDPRGIGSVNIIDALEFYVFGKCFMVGYNLFRSKIHYFVSGGGVEGSARPVITVL